MKTIRLLFILAFCSTAALAQQKVKDGTDSTGSALPNSNAILELESADKGLLHVRLQLVSTTNPAPLTQHVAGMMVYNTATRNDVEPGIYYNDGTRWIRLEGQGEEGNGWSSGSGAPSTNGNHSGDQYLDTNDGNIYQWDDVTQLWTLTGNIKGPQGPAAVVNPKDLTSGDGSVTVTNGLGATLVDAALKVATGGITTDKLADDAVTTDKVSDGAITPGKLSATASDSNKVATVQQDGTVIYETPSVSVGNVADAKDLTADDNSIEVTDGLGTTIKNTKLKVATGGITTDKLADDAVTSDKIKDGEVASTDIADGAIVPEKLSAAPSDSNKVATVQQDGTVVYEPSSVSTANVVDAKDLTADDNSIEVTDGLGTTIKNTKLKVSTGGITTDKLADDAVTSDKIKDGEVTTADLGDNAITTDKVSDGAITPGKLSATASDSNKVATVQQDGTVIYETPSVSAGNVADAKDLTADDNSIEVTDGLGTTIKNTKLKVATGGITTDKLADGSVTPGKLSATASDSNKVATVQQDGTVIYETPSVSAGNVADAKDLTADDNSIEVTDGLGTTIKNTKLKVSTGGITTDKLADNAVTSDKIKDGEVATTDIADGAIVPEKLSAAPSDSNKVATVQQDGTVIYETPSVSVGNVADAKDLTADDNSIEVTDGLGTTIKNTTLKVATGGITTDKLADDAVTTDKVSDGAITPGKLSATASDSNKVATVQQDGTVIYETPSVSAGNVADAKDLTADDNSIEVTDGLGTTIKNTKLKVSTGGITTDKLADDAVTTDKVSDGAITPGKLSATASDSNKVATVQQDGTVIYETPSVSAGNVADAKDLTADDNSIEVTDGLGTTIKNTTLKVATGGITTDKLADGSVTPGKLSATASDSNKVATVQQDGTVIYETPSVSVGNVADAKDLTADDNSIEVTDGLGTTIKNTKLKVATGGITTDKLADDAVTSDKIKDGEVASTDIADGAIVPEKLSAAPSDSNKVATVQQDGTVAYETPSVSVGNVADAKDLTADDNSIEVTDGLGTTIKNTKLKVSTGGITTDKLADDAVTSDKIKDGEVTTADLGDNAITTDKVSDGAITPGKLSATASDSNKVATVQQDGTVIYETPSVSAGNVADAKDLTADDNSIEVTDGLGTTIKNTTLKVATGGITTDKLADGSVTPGKLIATASDSNKVATVQQDGTVIYETPSVSVGNVADAKDLTADDNSIEVTDGLGTTIKNTKLKVATGGITTDKLADDAVTNDKLADNAVTTDKIKDGEVATTDIADGAIVPEKLSAAPSDSNKVATVQQDGTVAYETPSVSVGNVADAKDLTADDNSIEVTDGLGTTIKNTKLKVATGGITTDKLADSAVTTDKLAGNAVTSDKVLNGTILPEDLAVPGDSDLVLTTDANGDVIWANQSDLQVKAVNGLTKINDSVQLGGALNRNTEIDLNGQSLALKSLPLGDTTDNMVVVDPTTGDLKQMKAAPRFFYMPAVVFNTSVSGTYTRDLYAEYKKQFTGESVYITGENGGSPTGPAGTEMQYTGGLVGSAGAPVKVAVYQRDNLYYYISYYDQSVFSNLSIDANGVLTYTINSTAAETSYMNVIFVVK